MLNIVNIPIKDIKPYERNNKKHPKEQVDKLAKQIEKMGFDVPIVIDENNVIIKGHCRLLSAKQLKMKEVPCIIRTDLTEDQKKAARIADNKLSEIAEFDLDNLKFEMAELKNIDFDVSLTGFDNWDLLGSFDDNKDKEDEKENREEKLDDAHMPKEKLPEECKLGDEIRLGRHTLFCGDSLERLKQLPDNSIDSVVTDPPYGLSEHDTDSIIKCLQAWINEEKYTHNKDGFMGKQWDAFVPGPELWKEVLRVLKPGGHLLAFAGTRSMDLMSMAIRLAGFELRDSIGYMHNNGGAALMAWVHGQGFPKSLNVSTAIDEELGMEREVIGINPNSRPNSQIKGAKGFDRGLENNDSKSAGEYEITAPSSELAKQYSGYGTNLKPAFEPIILCRKPISEKNIALNVMKYGTGAINIDGCRIESGKDYHDLEVTQGGKLKHGNGYANQEYKTNDDIGSYKDFKIAKGESPLFQPASGRFPANLILDEKAAELLDEQSGILKSGGTPDSRKSAKTKNAFGAFNGEENPQGIGGSSGFASRFFYCAKSSPSERGELNTHCTVKPLSLMKYLVRLITPPNGVVLEPFCGSGTTLLAAELEGFKCVSAEMEPKHCDIIKYRYNNLKKE